MEELMNQSSDESSDESSDASSGEEYEILSDGRSGTDVNVSDGESISSGEDLEAREEDEEEPSSGFISKDKKITWYDKPIRELVGRNRAENVISTTPGPTRYAIARVDDIKSSFELFITKEMQALIIKMTNIEGMIKFFSTYFKNHIFVIASGTKVFGESWKEINNASLKAYFGLLLLAGVY